MKTGVLLIDLLVLAFLITPFAFADIGPSPSFSFSISNAEEYPEYDFYYAGNIWPEKLEPVDSAIGVYKLNTHITVYAVPESISISGTTFEEVASQSVVSQGIDLGAGNTAFSVASFDPISGAMVLEVESNTPDTGFGNQGLDLMTFAIIAAIIIVVAAVAFFLLKKGHNK